MKIPKKKRGRPKLSPEEKARRKAEREAAKVAAKKHGHGRKNKIVNKENTNIVERTSRTTYLLTPAGNCPVELHGFDKEAIGVWMSHAKNCRKSDGVHTVQSLTYWLRTYCSVFSEEYKTGSAHIKELAPVFDIVDYEPRLKKIAEEALARANLETISKYIKGEEI